MNNPKRSFFYILMLMKEASILLVLSIYI